MDTNIFESFRVRVMNEFEQESQERAFMLIKLKLVYLFLK